MNTSRILALLKWDLVYNRKLMLQGLALGVGLAAFLYQTFNSVFFTQPSNADTTSGFTLFLFIAFCYAGSSLIFFPIIKDNRRMQFLMLPATNVEKYIVRFFCSIVVIPLLTLAAAFAGYLLFAIIYYCIQGYWHNIMEYFSWFKWFEGNYIDSLTPAYLLMTATGILGGTFFRAKHAPFLTILTVIIISTTAAVVTGLIGYWIYEAGYHVEVTVYDEYTWCAKPLFWLIVLTHYVLCIWGSYVIFRRMQLKSHRLLNI